MTDDHPFYKPEKGHQAMVHWYDGLLHQFTFDHDLRYVDTRFGKTNMIVRPQDRAHPARGRGRHRTRILRIHRIHADF